MRCTMTSSPTTEKTLSDVEHCLTSNGCCCLTCFATLFVFFQSYQPFDRIGSSFPDLPIPPNFPGLQNSPPSFFLRASQEAKNQGCCGTPRSKEGGHCYCLTDRVIMTTIRRLFYTHSIPHKQLWHHPVKSCPPAQLSAHGANFRKP